MLGLTQNRPFDVCVFFSSWTPINHKKKRILNYGLSTLSWELLKQAELCCFCLWKNMWWPMTLKRASYCTGWLFEVFVVFIPNVRIHLTHVGWLENTNHSHYIWGKIWNSTGNMVYVPMFSICCCMKCRRFSASFSHETNPTSHQGATEDEVRGFGDSPFSSLELLWGPRKGSSEAPKR